MCFVWCVCVCVVLSAVIWNNEYELCIILANVFRVSFMPDICHLNILPEVLGTRPLIDKYHVSSVTLI
jgi:hypothetical protein